VFASGVCLLWAMPAPFLRELFLLRPSESSQCHFIQAFVIKREWASGRVLGEGAWNGWVCHSEMALCESVESALMTQSQAAICFEDGHKHRFKACSYSLAREQECNQ